MGMESEGKFSDARYSPLGWGWPRVLVLAVVGVGLAFLADATMRRCVGIYPTPPVRQLATWISRGMDWPVLLVASVVVSWGFWWRRRPQWTRFFAILGLACVLSGIGATVVRTVIGRTRPSADVEQGFYGPLHDGHLVMGRHKYSSFPSGHTAAVAGLLGALLALRRSWAWLGFLLTVAMGWSRMILNCHHFSDTVASLFVGASLGWWVATWLGPRFLRRWLPSVHQASLAS